MKFSFHQLFSRFLIRRLLLLALGNILLLLCIFLFLKKGGSFWDVIVRAGPNVAPIILAGIGLTGVIFTGAIDLSISSIIAVAGTVFGILAYHHSPALIAWGACLFTAWALSMLNALLIRGTGIPAIIITLAGLAFYRGIALIISELGIRGFSGNISVNDEAYHLPGKVYAGTILGVALLGAVVFELFGKTPRLWLASGNSPEACRLLGLNPGRILQSAFSLGGLFLGLGALVYATRIQAVEPARMALGFELQVIGAVVLGGTNIFGGEGSFVGTIFGAFFLYFVLELLIYAGVSPYYQDVITGAIILTVIGLDCVLHKREKMLQELS